MDAAALAPVEADLVAWGVLDREPALGWSRRFRGAVMRAAAGFAAMEKAGEKPAGHPLEVAARSALEGWPTPAGASVRREHVLLAVAVELAALPDGVREMLGA